MTCLHFNARPYAFILAICYPFEIKLLFVTFYEEYGSCNVIDIYLHFVHVLKQTFRLFQNRVLNRPTKILKSELSEKEPLIK